MKSVLVTGGAGFIGSHACKALHKAGFLPVTFDNLSNGKKESVLWGPLIEGDLLDKTKLKALFLEYQPVAVMHFASSILVTESLKDPAKYYENNVVTTLNLLERCIEPKIPFIFSGSCAAFGIPNRTPISEECTMSPINPYGRSKLIIEWVLKDYERAYGFPHAILRYFNAAGADLDGEIGENHKPETHLIPLLIEAANGKREITIYGDDFPTEDGFAIRDFIHVEDLVHAHLLALNYLFSKNKSIDLNLGSGKGYSVMETLKAAEKILQKKIPYKISPKREGEAAVLVANPTKAMSLLDWEPVKSDLPSMIRSAGRWLIDE